MRISGGVHAFRRNHPPLPHPVRWIRLSERGSSSRTGLGYRPVNDGVKPAKVENMRQRYGIGSIRKNLAH